MKDESVSCQGSLCRASKAPNMALPMHPCPYQQEINDDNNPEYCNCCEECESLCRDEI